MEIWWNSLTALERLSAAIALPATVLLVIQTVLLLLGLTGASDGSVDVDVDGEGVPDAVDGHLDELDPGIRLFTVRGFVSFFTVFGWGTLALSRGGMASGLALTIGIVLGTAAMVLTGMALRWANKLQSDGTIDYKNAVGRTGRVYIPIPPLRSGTGKVSVLMQEHLCECDAVTDDDKRLETDCEVVITGVSGRNILTVRRKQLL